jgi:hypothetical protein
MSFPGGFSGAWAAKELTTSGLTEGSGVLAQPVATKRQSTTTKGGRGRVLGRVCDKKEVITNIQSKDGIPNIPEKPQADFALVSKSPTMARSVKKKRRRHAD